MDELANANFTEGDQNNSRIINMHVDKINDFLENNGIAIIPGFQGISKKEILLRLEVVARTRQQLLLQKFFKLTLVKFIQMLMVFILLTQIKYQLRKK